MPWQEKSTMEEREEFVRLACLEGVNRRDLCRRFGISAPTGYKWLRRYQAGEALSDRSRRPQRSPARVCCELEDAILAVRRAHPAWGARKIYGVLARTHAHLPAVSTIHSVLRRHGLIHSRERVNTAWQRFEEEAANRLWQMDFKGRVRLGDASLCHPLTIVDDHSRFAICVAVCTDQRTHTVQNQLEQSFNRYGLPDAFLVDNGSPWGSSYRTSRWTPLRVWLARLGVSVIYARPYHPQTKGKNERFNRTLNEEVLALRCFRTKAQIQTAFDDWRLIYNHHRPHEALGGKVPASRYQLSKRRRPASLPEVSYPTGSITRKVPKTRPQVSFKGRKWFVPKAFKGQTLAIRQGKRTDTFDVFFGANRVAKIDLRTK